jgi:hypothetical protein
VVQRREVVVIPRNNNAHLVLGLVLLQSVIKEFGGHIVIKAMGVQKVSIEIVFFDSLKVALFAAHRF